MINPTIVHDISNSILETSDRYPVPGEEVYKGFHFLEPNIGRVNNLGKDVPLLSPFTPTLLNKDTPTLSIKPMYKIIMCSTGLHGSEKLVQAFNYFSSTRLTYCTFWGDVSYQDDKLVARHRRIESIMTINPATLTGVFCDLYPEELYEIYSVNWSTKKERLKTISKINNICKEFDGSKYAFSEFIERFIVDAGSTKYIPHSIIQAIQIKLDKPEVLNRFVTRTMWPINCT